MKFDNLNIMTENSMLVFIYIKDKYTQADAVRVCNQLTCTQYCEDTLTDLKASAEALI